MARPGGQTPPGGVGADDYRRAATHSNVTPPPGSGLRLLMDWRIQQCPIRHGLLDTIMLKKSDLIESRFELFDLKCKVGTRNLKRR